MIRSFHRARIGTALLFVGCGAGIGTWAASVAHVQRDAGLSDRALGFALLAMAVGALVSMPLAGRLAARYGTACLSSWSGPAFALSVLLPPFSRLCGDWAMPALAGALFLIGGTHGATDIAMNGEAARLEREGGRAMMSSFHAGWSLGGMAGSAFTSLLFAWGWSAELAMGLSAAMLMLVFLAALLINRPVEGTPSQHREAPAEKGWTPPLIYLGCLCFLAFMVEGGMMDWSAVYMSTLSKEGMALSGGGFASFSLMMAMMRLVGDGIITRLGAVRTCALSALIAAIGLATALATRQPLVSMAGFALLGIGMANVVPILFAASGRRGGNAGVATVATLGYAGGLCGPPIIGFMAGQWGLRLALTSLLAAIAIIGLNARSAANRPKN
ncbi:MFS transporter [Granulibacter bethesdensis]|uniref:MFS transporter n=1 Tax=Granulibacter bethesdensis TaxID=364410 RepID=UPI0009D704BB